MPFNLINDPSLLPDEVYPSCFETLAELEKWHLEFSANPTELGNDSARSVPYLRRRRTADPKLIITHGECPLTGLVLRVLV